MMMCVCVCVRAHARTRCDSLWCCRRRRRCSIVHDAAAHTHTFHTAGARARTWYSVGVLVSPDKLNRARVISFQFSSSAERTRTRAGSANQYGASTVMCVRVVTYILMLLSAHRDRERVSILELLWICGGGGCMQRRKRTNQLSLASHGRTKHANWHGAPELSYLFTVKFSVSIGTRAHTSNNELKCWIFMLLFFYIV